MESEWLNYIASTVPPPSQQNDWQIQQRIAKSHCTGYPFFLHFVWCFGLAGVGMGGSSGSSRSGKSPLLLLSGAAHRAITAVRFGCSCSCSCGWRRWWSHNNFLPSSFCFLWTLFFFFSNNSEEFSLLHVETVMYIDICSLESSEWEKKLIQGWKYSREWRSWQLVLLADGSTSLCKDSNDDVLYSKPNLIFNDDLDVLFERSLIMRPHEDNPSISKI